MTQISRPQQGRQATYGDAGGYTAAQWAQIESLQVQDRTTQGVYNYLDAMEVTNPSGTTIRVASGAALVNGHYGLNVDLTDPSVASNVDFAVVYPVVGNRIDKVILVQNNTDDAYTGLTDYGGAVLFFPTVLTDYGGLESVPARSCRLAILTGVDGGAARDLVQDPAVTGDIWMLEIARYTIKTILSVLPLIILTDMRDYAPKVDTNNIEDDAVDDTKVGNRVPQFYRRQGGNAVNWQSPGTTTYIPTMVKQQGGTAQWNGVAATSGTFTVNYPVDFGNLAAPLVFATCLKDSLGGDINTGISVLTVMPWSAFRISWRDNQGNAHTSLNFMWFAVGDE